MEFKFEIHNILRQEGVNSYDANKAIFGIATIGLLIGKDRLREIIHDFHSMDARNQFDADVSLSISNKEYEKVEIVQEALNLISKAIDTKTIERITEVILEHDLLNIVLYMNIFDVDMGMKDCPITSVSWITMLVAKILKIHGGNSLLNIDCGTGDFIQKMVDSGVERITGYTYSYDNYIIAKIRKHFSSKEITIHNEKLFYPITEERYDMAYNAYPLIYKYESMNEVSIMTNSWDFPFHFKRKYSSNMLWIVNALQNIKPNGIVVAFVANGVLFNEVDTDIRKYLIERNYIDSIISLPGGILPFSGVASSLVILKKNVKGNNKVRMVDATKICQKQRRYSIFTEEDIERIIGLYTEVNYTEFAFDVSYEDIIRNDYNFGMGRYVETGYTMVNPCALEDVTRSIFRGYQIKASEFDEISVRDEEDTDYRIINISDIRADGFVDKNLQAIKVDDTRKFSKYCVEDGDIIITAKNTTIKAAIYREQRDYKAILTGNLIAIRVNEKKMNPFYLKAFLDSELGEALLKSIQTGTTVFSISPNSLKRLIVSVPDKDIQDDIANEYKETLYEIEDLINSHSQKSLHLKEIYNNKIK